MALPLCPAGCTGGRRLTESSRPGRRRYGARAMARRIIVGFCAVGALLRVEDFFARPSLWLDEAAVALNIVQRNPVALARPLSGEQGAPIGWLWTQRLMVVVFG